MSLDLYRYPKKYIQLLSPFEVGEFRSREVKSFGKGTRLVGHAGTGAGIGVMDRGHGPLRCRAFPSNVKLDLSSLQSPVLGRGPLLRGPIA